MQAEATRIETSERLNGEKQWVGKYPMLRMICAIVSNGEIIRLFLSRYDLANDRLQVENRKSEGKKPVTVWELVANVFNDPEFSPTTEALPDLHPDYALPIDVGYSTVCLMVEATPEKCESRFNGMMVDLKCIINNWKLSGQGDGGLVDNNEGDEGQRGGMDERKNFVKYQQSYLLYLWHILEKYNLLVSAVQKLSDVVSAGNGADGVPSIISGARDDGDDGDSIGTGGSKRSTKKKPDTDTALNGISASVSSLSNSINALQSATVDCAKLAVEEERKSREAVAADKKQEANLKLTMMYHGKLDRVRGQKRQAMMELLGPNKPCKAIQDYLHKELKALHEELIEIQDHLTSLEGTPKKRNFSSVDDAED